MTATNAEQVACLKREIALRKSVYPKFIASGRMTQAEADKQIETMTACLHTVIAFDLPEEATPAMIAAGCAFLEGADLDATISRKDYAASVPRLWRAMVAAWIASR